MRPNETRSASLTGEQNSFLDLLRDDFEDLRAAVLMRHPRTSLAMVALERDTGTAAWHTTGFGPVEGAGVIIALYHGIAKKLDQQGREDLLHNLRLGLLGEA